MKTFIYKIGPQCSFLPTSLSGLPPSYVNVSSSSRFDHTTREFRSLGSCSATRGVYCFRNKISECHYYPNSLITPKFDVFQLLITWLFPIFWKVDSRYIMMSPTKNFGWFFNSTSVFYLNKWFKFVGNGIMDAFKLSSTDEAQFSFNPGDFLVWYWC